MLLEDDLRMSRTEALQIPSLALAYVGDAVFELFVRTWLMARGGARAGKMHGDAVGLVSAPAQAEAARLLAPSMTEEELSVMKRGRNARVNSVPKGATDAQYHAATGLEALFGFLFVTGQQERARELFNLIVKDRGELAP